MRYMLDTNICIYAIKKKPAGVISRIMQHDPADICISSMTYAELMHGVEKSNAPERNRLAVMLLLANIEVLDFDAKAAEHYGRIRSDLEKCGRVMGTMDMLIAGHALSCGCVVVTNNTKEFERVDGLTIDNWA